MRLYNSLSRQIEEVGFDKSSNVNMYVCGVTPYSASHLGHAMCAVVFCDLRSYIQYNASKVTHDQKLTEKD